MNQKLLRGQLQLVDLVARLRGIKRQGLFENTALEYDGIHVMEEEMRDKVPDYLTLAVNEPFNNGSAGVNKDKR